MTTEASSPEPENKERNKDDERRRVALVLLFLLLSFICIFCSSQGALFFIDRDQIAGHMRSALQADYGLEAPVEFPRVLIDSIVPEIIGDNFDLEATPVIVSAGSIAVLPQPVAQITSTPTPVPPIPTLTPTSTPSPTPVPPTSAPPEDTPEPPPPPPSPTLEPTLPPPSPTSLPPSPTIPPPAPTISLPSPTSPPPTSPPPATSPPPTSPPSTPVPNNPPVAVDDVATTNEDVATFPINVLANDSDSDGMLVPGSVTVTSGPANGATSVNATTGEITYTPNLNFNGIDTFTYQVCDDDGACDTATVTVTVNSVNDPPVANDDIGTVNQDTPTTINVATNDTDVDGNLDPTSVITVTNPLSGTTALGPGAGEITYTPNAGISGVDTFSYQICDVAPPTPAPLCDTALVTITITDTVPLPPTNLRAAPGNMQISLGWDHTPEPDLLGYRVYRSDNGGPYSLISTTMVITKYSDFSPPLNNGFTYAYTVTAIDAASNESGPSNIASAIPLGIITFTNSVTCGGITFTNCIEAGGPPDNVSAAISMTGVITFDFGAGQGIIDGPGYDMVFYELYRSISMGIRLDFTRIELSTDGATWFTVFEWDGDDPGDIVGTNIDSYANDFNGEQEDEPIPEADLYPGGAGSHGVAIDIGVSAPSGNLYRFVRITDPGSSSGPQKHTDIDAIERLN